MTDPALQPLELRAPRGADTVEIDWADGHTSRYPNALLRGYCPCAGCQGHSGEIKYIPGNNDVIDGIEEVGNYGVSFTWGDGHGGGIYAFSYLRALCACDACLPGSRVERRESLPR